MKKNYISFSSIFIFFLISFSSYAQTIIWDGGGDGVNWEDPDNWNPAGYPCATCDINIVSATNTVILNSTYTVKSLIVKDSDLELQASAQLTLNNSSGHAIELNNISELMLDGGDIYITNAVNEGIYLESGKLTIATNGLIDINNIGGNGIKVSPLGELDLLKTATLTVSYASDHVIDNYGLITNEGSMNLSTLSGQDAIINAGSFENDAELNIMATHSSVGILNSSSGIFHCLSSSDIEINNANIGISNEGDFEIVGDLLIDNSNSSGIRNTAGLINTGSVLIEGTTGFDISCLSSFKNNGDITLTRTTNTTALGIGANGFFENNGPLTIENAGGACIYNLDFTGEFEQNISGTLECTNGYIRNSGLFNLGGNSIIQTLPLTGTPGNFGLNLMDPNAEFNITGDLTITNFNTAIQNIGTDSELGTGASSSIMISKVNIGIYNSEEFFNAGLIDMDEIEHYGIYSNGDFRSYATANIIIDSVSLDSYPAAIELDGDVLNQGDIWVKDKSMPSIRSDYGVFDNAGILNLDGVSTSFQDLENGNSGEVNTNELEVYNTLESYGTVRTNGALMADLIENYGMIEVENGGIRHSILHNFSGGTVQVLNADTQNTTTMAGAIVINEELTNEGTIKLTNVPQAGLLYIGTDSLINKGIIEVDNCSNGIKQAGSASVSNHQGAEIKVNNASANGVLFENSFVNRGSIEVDSSQTGIKKQGAVAASTFDNYGSINLDNTSSLCLAEFKTLHNHSSGSIDIEGGLGSYITELTNHGSISFSDATDGFTIVLMNNYGSISGNNLSIGSVGLYLGDFTSINHSTGTISLDNVDTGIKSNFSEPVITFINHGEIQMDNVETGITCLGSGGENYGTFTINTAINSGISGMVNKSGGEMYFNDTAADGITINEECGLIVTNGVVSSTINYGFIQIEEENSSLINIDNHKVLVNLKGIRKSNNGNSSVNFRNFGIQSGIINATPSEGINELNVLRTETGYALSSATLYTNPANTIVGGAFIAADDAVVLNAAGVNADTLYFPVSYGPSCTRSMKIPITQIGPCSSITSAETVTPYNFPNYEWHRPENWSNGELPGPCTQVIISRFVTIPAAAKARAHSIDTSTSIFNGPLLVNPGSVLEVDPSL